MARWPGLLGRPGRTGSDARAGFRVVVDLDEAQVVVRHLLGGRVALQVAGEEALEGVPPDRAADGEADEALDGRRLAQPVVDLVVGGSAAEQHADDVLAALARAGL